MKTYKKIISVVSVISGLLFATAINVPADQPTIQAGIDFAVDGDTVLVASGTYYENINFNGKNIVVTSVEGAENTIIDGNQNGSVVIFRFGEASNAILDGFTIRNGNGYHYSPIPDSYFNTGGGIFVLDSSPTLLNLIVKNNTIEFIDESVLCGGGIAFWNSESTIENVTIMENSTQGFGGGVFMQFSEVTFSGVTVKNNTAYNYAGICIMSGPLPDPESNITFSTENRCNIFSNVSESGEGNDLKSDYFIEVIVDTFTVINPTEYHSSPLDNFTFDILNEVNSQIIYVTPNGSDETGDGSEENPFATIQLGIDTAVDGDTVLVASGTYVENINFNGKNIVVTSVEGAENTIIDGDQNGSVVTFESEENSTTILNGFTVQNGSGKLVDNEGFGLEWCGGGVYVLNSNPQLSNLIIKNNDIYEGKGLGVYCFNAVNEINNCNINDNIISVGFGQGGGIYCVNSSLIIDESNIYNNLCSMGSGICSNNSTIKVSNTEISNNLGGIHGAGLYVRNSIAELFLVNITENSGEGVYVDGIGESIVSVISSNIVANSDIGINCWYNDNKLIIVNSIILENINMGVNNSGINEIFYTNIQDGWDGEGNTDLDPLFIDPENGNYTLQPNSPCIDAGTSFFVFEGDTLVNMSEDEYIGTAPDMGAFEYESVISTTEEAGQFPTDFQLLNAYPNPFNPSTTISFQLPQQETINLSVYNVKGELVEVLLNKKLITGYHQFDWKPNSNIPSGSYFVKLTSSNFGEVSKIVYLK